MNRILLIGPFPPPVHGMALVNESVRNILIERGEQFFVINTAPVGLEQSIVTRIRRIPRMVAACTELVSLSIEINGVAYMSVSGGYGQLYEIAFALIARLRKLKIVMHHHSFAYLHRYSFMFSLFAMIAGATAVHIVQSPSMRARLMRLYGLKRVISVSNAVLVKHHLSERNRTRVKLNAIGFLSNISAEKGVFEFLEVAACLHAAGLHINAIVAGPFSDRDTELKVRERIASLPGVEYVGPLYGAKKKHFFDSIDVFVFPSAYKNETEGIVNIEALSAGVPVIAFGRGSIPEMLGSKGGVALPQDSDFVSSAVAIIRDWVSNAVLFRQASRSARERYEELQAQNRENRAAFLRELIPKKGPDNSF